MNQQEKIMEGNMLLKDGTNIIDNLLNQMDQANEQADNVNFEIANQVE